MSRRPEPVVIARNLRLACKSGDLPASNVDTTDDLVETVRDVQIGTIAGNAGWVVEEGVCTDSIVPSGRAGPRKNADGAGAYVDPSNDVVEFIGDVEVNAVSPNTLRKGQLGSRPGNSCGVAGRNHRLSYRGIIAVGDIQV